MIIIPILIVSLLFAVLNSSTHFDLNLETDFRSEKLSIYKWCTVLYSIVQEARNQLSSFEPPTVVKIVFFTVNLCRKITALLFQLFSQNHHDASSVRNTNTSALKMIE